MMKEFTINGKAYKPAEITFNTMCDLEDMGVDIYSSGRPMSTMRAYLALCMGSNTYEAGKELEAHIVNGGNLDELSEALDTAVSESGFFQAIAQKSN